MSGLLPVPENERLSFSGRNRIPSDLSLEADGPLKHGEISCDELREEVESLVRDALPEEINYVEEMLARFRGREDHLLKALRRIQMRSNGSICVSADPDDFLFEDGGKISLDSDLWRRDSSNQIVMASGTSQILPCNSQGETSSLEEKKNDSLPANSLAHDEDENDVLPEELPYMVQTSSMRNLKVSNLTAQSSTHSLDASYKSTSPLNVSSRRKAVALIKLRSWDPAKPEYRLKCLAATHIFFKSHNKEKAFSSESRTVTMHENEIASSRHLKKKLSMVREEPEKPSHRGDSYFEEGVDNLMGIANTENCVFWGDCGELCVGSLVGIQLMNSPSPSSSNQNQSSSAASASSAADRKYEWRVGNSITMKKICFLPLTALPKLHRQIENNVSSLCELVMDGLPPSSFMVEEAELIFEALGTNTSIKRLSMRYSNVDDDIASLFALALVDNTAIFQLSLEGNEMTNVSAKNFYSVLKKNNGILRLLDLSKNPMIDYDVQNALDQFMEQRALKRTLTRKAEKAKRAAKGMPPDAALDADADVVSGQITVVCHRNMMDDVAVHSNSRQQSQVMSSKAKNGTVKPYRGESFRDYMQRMDQLKEDVHQSASYRQKLSEDSIRERVAFETFAGSESLLEPKSQVFLKQPVESLGIAQSTGPPTESLGDSISSSITTRSTNKQVPENDIITTTSDDGKKSYEPNKTVAWADRFRAPPGRVESLETQQSADPTVEKARIWLGESDNDSTTSEIAKSGSFISMATEASAPSGEKNLADKDLGISFTPETPGTTPHPYHNTQVSEGSIQISQEDYMDDKTDERAMRRRLATSLGAVGAYHIDEVAPSRQSLGGGRRGRRNRSESQRRARLAQLTGGGSDTENTAPAVDESLDPPEVILNADIEQAGDLFPSTQRRKSRLSALGLDDEESGMDKIICAILALLLVALLVMIILLMK